MLDKLERLPADIILGLAAACRADPNPAKVDLSVGIYMDEQGLCPVFESVRRAQQALVGEEVTKAYMAPAEGMKPSTWACSAWCWGGHPALLDARVGNIQTPGLRRPAHRHCRDHPRGCTRCAGMGERPHLAQPFFPAQQRGPELQDLPLL